MDPAIRTWVFVPIVVITFLIGILRHYVSIILSSPKKPTTPSGPGALTPLQTLKDSQTLLRARLLRENGRFLPRQAYSMRKSLFNDPERGLLVVAQKREAAPSQNMMMNPDMMSEMMKGNLTNVLPMIAVGGWINYTFSGFVTTKVPFPLTQKFKMMLQRGIFLQSLDPSWVSSASWYFLCVFGLRQIYQLVLGADNAADQTRMMQDQMSGGTPGMPQDSRALFKAEWEALELHEHVYELRGIDEELAANVAASQQTDKASLMQKKTG